MPQAASTTFDLLVVPAAARHRPWIWMVPFSTCQLWVPLLPSHDQVSIGWPTALL